MNQLEEIIQNIPKVVNWDEENEVIDRYNARIEAQLKEIHSSYDLKPLRERIQALFDELQTIYSEEREAGQKVEDLRHNFWNLSHPEQTSRLPQIQALETRLKELNSQQRTLYTEDRAVRMKHDALLSQLLAKTHPLEKRLLSYVNKTGTEKADKKSQYNYLKNKCGELYVQLFKEEWGKVMNQVQGYSQKLLHTYADFDKHRDNMNSKAVLNRQKYNALKVKVEFGRSTYRETFEDGSPITRESLLSMEDEMKQLDSEYIKLQREYKVQNSHTFQWRFERLQDAIANAPVIEWSVRWRAIDYNLGETLANYTLELCQDFARTIDAMTERIANLVNRVFIDLGVGRMCYTSFDGDFTSQLLVVEREVEYTYQECSRKDSHECDNGGGGYGGGSGCPMKTVKGTKKVSDYWY